MSDDLDEAILRHLDGAAAPDEDRLLRERLLADPDARSRYATLACRQQALEDHFRQRRVEAAPKPATRRAYRRRGAPASGFPPLAIAASVAAAVLFIALLFASLPDQPRTAAPTTKPPVEARRPAPEPRPERIPPPAPAPIVKPVPVSPRPGVGIPSEDGPKKRVAQPEAPSPPKVPKPQPPPAPKPAPQERSRVAVARLDRVVGAVRIVSQGGTRLAKAGESLLSEDAIEVPAPDGAATFAYTDGTSVILGPHTKIESMSLEGGKRFLVARGEILAQVARQPRNAPMVIHTAHADATVLGTTLRIVVDLDPTKGTRLDVEEGRVRIKRRIDGKSALVRSGHFAVAATGVKLVSKTFFKETFHDLRKLRELWVEIPGGLPAKIERRGLEVDTSPRSNVFASQGGWYTPGGLRTRHTFGLPLQVAVDLSLGRASDSVAGTLLFKPLSAPSGQGDAVYSGRNVLHLNRRGNALQLCVESRVVASADLPLPAGRMERITASLDREWMRVSVNGRELIAHRHGLRTDEPYQIGLEASSKTNAPAGIRARFADAVVTAPGR